MSIVENPDEFYKLCSDKWPFTLTDKEITERAKYYTGPGFIEDLVTRALLLHLERRMASAQNKPETT
jgi:hypothetical protein